MKEILNIMEREFKMNIKENARGGIALRNEEYKLGLILTKSKILYIDTKETFLSDMSNIFKSQEKVKYIENKTIINDDTKNEIISILNFLNDNKNMLIEKKNRKKKDPKNLEMPKINCKITEKQELVLNEMGKFLKDENMLNKTEVIKSIVENHNITEKIAKGVLGSLVAKELIFINGEYIGFMNL